MPRVLVVPGLAVRRYARPPVRALRRAGIDATLLRPPAWTGAPADLAAYGARLAEAVEARGADVDLLVGLSVGTQAAAVASTRTRRVRRLLLVSPTVDPSVRTWRRLIRAWLGGDGADDAPSTASQIPDWAHAGIPRIALGMRSALRLRLELVMPAVTADVTVVHAEHDSLGTRDWAARVAAAGAGRLVDRPGAPHSWPVGDAPGFVRMVDELTA